MNTAKGGKPVSEYAFHEKQRHYKWKSIWTNRPLFLICTCFILAISIGFLILPEYKLLMIAISLLSIFVSVILILTKHTDKRRASALIACLLAVVLGLGESYLHFDKNYASFDSLDGVECYIEGTVASRRYEGANLSSFEIYVSSVNGEEVGNVYAILDCTYPSDLQAGDVFTAEVTATALSDYSTNIYDERSLIGQGYSIAFTSLEDSTCTVIKGARPDGIIPRLGTYFASLRAEFSSRLTSSSDKDSGTLATALFLGERSSLSDTVRRDFSRSGVSHILALSGLHVTVLFGLLELLLRALRLPKKPRAILLSFLSIGYLIMTGCSPSATRAVIMLLITYLALVFSEESDALTSLGFAGAVILAFSPTSVADIGFWMSFASSFGLITVMPVLQKQLTPKIFAESSKKEKSAISLTAKSIFKRALRGIIRLCVGIAVGVVAMLFTSWTSVAGIGEISILSPITTLILTPLCALILIGSAICIPLSGTGLGALGLTCVHAAEDIMEEITAYLASSSWHIFSLREPYVPIICAATLILTFIPLPTRKKSGLPEISHRKRSMLSKRMLICPLVGICAMIASLAVSALMTSDEMEITYLQPSSASEYIILNRGKDAVLCDFSNGSHSSVSRAAKIAKENGAVEISALLLTHYHSRLPGALAKLFEDETVRSLWIPEPTDGDDYYTMLSCIEKAENAQPPVEVRLYRDGDKLSVFGEAEITTYRSSIDRSVQPIHLMHFKYGDDAFTFCSASVFEATDGSDELAHNLISESNTLILSSHGPLVKQSYDLTSMLGMERIILANEEVAAHARLPEEYGADMPSMMLGQVQFRFDAVE